MGNKIKNLIFKIVITFICVDVVAFPLPQIPDKFSDSKMTKKVAGESRFLNLDLESERFVTKKRAEWKACHQEYFYYPESGHRDSLSTFLKSNNYLNSLSEMEEMNLTESEVNQQPWSGDYWSYADGILGSRYQDEGFFHIYNWLPRFEYIQNNPAPLLIKTKGQLGVNTLSPSEKYDLIIGDQRFDLTASMWNQGKRYYDQTGSVEPWMGICHGWASAAIMEPRPKTSIEVVSYDNNWKINLNPSEIKGLVSYSWATNPYPADTLGSRCNVKDPPRDSNGRVLDPDCQDLNPGSWHIAMVHLVGQLKKPFVMDATYDYEVWNQPIVDYKYAYFNPQTGKSAETLDEAMIELNDFVDDPFSKARSPKAKAVVGIVMKVGYVIETSANSSQTDSPKDDVIRWVSYKYDLEMDKDSKILGGEWHSFGHPDFIWYPRNGPRGPGDARGLPRRRGSGI